MEQEQVLREQVSLTAKNDYFDERPTYEEGYYVETNTVIRLVENKSKKVKPYKVTGIKDTASENNWKAWLYLGPVLVLLVVFLLYPLINTICIAFMKDYDQITFTSDGFTLENFGVIFGITQTSGGGYETNFVQYAIPNTFIIVFVTVPLSTLIALLISVALNSIRWFKKILQTVFFLPYVTNTIAIGMVFAVMFDDNGIINYIFNSSVDWLGSSRWVAMVPLCFYIIWSSIPFKILVFLSGLQNIDEQYYNAAKVDGASKWKILTKITVPLMSPQILYIVVTSFIGAFKEYSSIVGLFNGAGTVSGSYNMYTIVYYIYDNMTNHTSYAAAAAVFLFVVILFFTLIQLGVSKKRVYY